MEIHNKSVDLLIPYDKNTKKHDKTQINNVAESIKQYGFVQPIVIDKENVVVIGHCRLLAAKQLKMKEVPCVCVEDLTEEQVKALRIVDNKSNESEWDFDSIADELAELDLSDFDFDFGIEGDEEKETEIVEDEAPEVDEDAEPIAKLGDIWQLGRHRLMCGDSTDKETVEMLMDGKKADMVFTDPPYGVDYEGINNDSRSGLEDLLTSAFENYKENCIDGASIYCFHSDKCADIFHAVFRSFCHFSSMIIWEKQSLVLSQGDYQSIHEPCLYGWFDNGTHRFFGDRKQTSVWKFDRKSIEGHTTPKPIGFICKALENSSKKNEKVLDLFGGSGSTLIACEQLDRICYMMELDPKYCDVIIKRWETFTGEKAVKLN
jgi:site-specific DNA-methyltransferase (adenine-specific)